MSLAPFFHRPGFGDVPVGTVVAFAGALGTPSPATASPPGSAAPSGQQVTTIVEAWGWMLCDGRILPIYKYPELFAVLGYLYGGSDDQFCIPDYRGYFLRGMDDGRGIDKDSSQNSNRTAADGSGSPYQGVGSYQQDALQTHEHCYYQAPAPATPSQGGQAAGATTAQGALTYNGPTSSLASPPGTVRVSQVETRSINVYVNYLIKFS